LVVLAQEPNGSPHQPAVCTATVWVNADRGTFSVTRDEGYKEMRKQTSQVIDPQDITEYPLSRECAHMPYATLYFG